MKLFNRDETKTLTTLLEKSGDPEVTLSLDSLHGFLFGLAIIPDPIMPSEWFPIIFGKEIPAGNSAEETQKLFLPLFTVYNRMMAEENRGKLVFPFDPEKMQQDDFEQIGDWTYGLYCAMRLRPATWGLDRAEDEDISEEYEEILTACAVIMAIAMPDDMPNLFETEEEMTEADKDEQMTTLFAMLPTAVQMIQEYADQGRLDIPSDANGMEIDEHQHTETGCNESCPCGSGKK